MVGIHKMESNKLDLNLLRALLTVLETQSVTRMGERMGWSQPAASRVMSRLRAQVGDPILVRTSKGYLATPRALALRDSASAALRAAEAVFSSGSFEPASSSRRFTIASTDYGCASVLAPLARPFATLAPQAVLRVLPWGEGTLGALEDGALDLALYADESPLPADFHTRDLFRDSYAILCREGHPVLARLKPGSSSLAPLADHVHAVMLYPDGRRFTIDDAMHRLGLMPKNASIELPYFAAAPYVVAQSELLMLLPTRLAEQAVKMNGLVMRPLPAKILSFGYRLIWHERVHRDAEVQWLREQIVAASSGE
jgi:DNA-binding transcriptional LysR family regulator